MKRTLIIAGILGLMAFTPQEAKTYKLEFTAEETQIIFDALGELPSKKVEVIRAKIAQQVNQQNQNDKK